MDIFLSQQYEVEFYSGIHDDDMVVFMNFRSDRARQLTDSILNETFKEFERPSRPHNINYLTLTSHDEKQKKLNAYLNQLI